MKPHEEEYFEISAVARLTGVSSHVLRVWERRYGVVSPLRSDSKRRRYRREDIQRLSLLKSLVDSGHTIGSIAKLSTAQLQERLDDHLETKATTQASEPASQLGGCRLAVVGTAVRRVARAASDQNPSLRLVGEFSSAKELEASLQPGAADLLLVEQEILFPEECVAIQALVERMEARCAIVVYQFAQEAALQSLALTNITALHAPINAAEIFLACLANHDANSKCCADDSNCSTEAEEDLAPFPPENFPERRFSDDQLIQLSQLPGLSDCDCLRHLTEILTKLVAFERYSVRCENRDTNDTVSHSHLNRSTALARARMEEALARLLSEEGITL